MLFNNDCCCKQCNKNIRPVQNRLKVLLKIMLHVHHPVLNCQMNILHQSYTSCHLTILTFSILFSNSRCFMLFIQQVEMKNLEYIMKCNVNKCYKTNKNGNFNFFINQNVRLKTFLLQLLLPKSNQCVNQCINYCFA